MIWGMESKGLTMNAREIYLQVLGMKDADRTLRWELGYWGGALLEWYREGLPRKFGFGRNLVYGEDVAGPGLQYPMPSYTDDFLFAHDVSDYFCLDKGPAPFPFNWFYSPRWDKKIIFESADKVEYVGTDGIRRLAFKDERSMPTWLGHPVTCEADWEEIVRDRLNPNNLSQRYTVPDIVEFVSRAKDRDYPMCLYGSPIGFFGILRFLIGEENLYYWYYDHSNLLKRILDHLCEMWLAIAEELTAMIDFDFGRFYEDMAYKVGSLISPAMFRNFMTPYYRRLIDFAKSRGIEHFVVDSDGYVEELIPLFMEAGVTTLLPFEVAAGNDVEKVRDRYPRLGMLGGVDKSALSSKGDIDRELDKVARMIPRGGYIPYIDHAVPPGISWENFRYYRERLNDIIDTVKVRPRRIDEMF
jgi:uroporphyrinogen decarboxylase